MKKVWINYISVLYLEKLNRFVFGLIFMDDLVTNELSYDSRGISTNDYISLLTRRKESRMNSWTLFG